MNGNGNGNDNGSKNGQNWWKMAMTMAGAVIAGALVSWTGVKTQLEEQGKDITRLQLRLDQQEGQLNRVEGKVDRVLEKLKP